VKSGDVSGLSYVPTASMSVYPNVIPEDGDKIQYSTGDRVMHEKYGPGTIKDTEGTVSGQKITIEFDEDAKKRKFLTAFTPLVRI
jgi:hypothetical protein